MIPWAWQSETQTSLINWASSWENLSSGELKPACSATETSQSLEIAKVETRDIIPSRQRTTYVVRIWQKLVFYDVAQLWMDGIQYMYSCGRKIFHGRSNIIFTFLQTLPVHIRTDSYTSGKQHPSNPCTYIVTRGPLVLYRSPECWGYVKMRFLRKRSLNIAL